MRLASAFALFAAFAFVLYGWGWTARRLFSNASRAESRSWPSTAASGMAAIVFLGGVLNLARLAYPWALALVAIVGVALGVLALKSAIKRGGNRSISNIWLLAAVVFCFVVLTQVPPKAYNFHDDYQKYFVHPVRMLETGTVFGSPLNDIGFDTIGGQAFLDGFVVAAFPIRYINGVDAAFAFVLCILLASQFTKGRPELIPLAMVCALSVVFINPQYVNISALYTGSLLMMAVFEEASEEDGSSPAVTGLLYAALLALKSTFALFVVLHLAATPFIRGWRWASRAALASALFFLPWVLLHATHYAAILHPGAPMAETGVRDQETFNMFSTEALDYGSTPANYTGLMLAIGVCGLMIAWSKRRIDMAAASCFAAVAAYFIMIYVSGPRNAGFAQAVRYFTPFAIAAAPAAFGSAGVNFLDAAKPRAQWIRLGLPFLLAAVPVFAFAPSLRDRVNQAVHSGSVLAFSWLAPDPDYLEYNRQVLDGDMRQRVVAAQAAIPAGEAMVVWINAPFYLDFKRNRIADVEPGAGLIAPWSGLPTAIPDARYFIWEYGGYATVDPDNYREELAEGPDLMRRVAAARLNMTEKLDALMQRSQKLYDDGAIAVFRE
jgi:hypothetical protein